MPSSLPSKELSLWLLPICGLLLLLYWNICVELGVNWYEDPNYSHGFLVPFLSAYFLWERWGEWKTTPASPSLWGIGFLGVGLCSLLVGLVGAELYTQRGSLIVVLAGLILLLYGWRSLWIVSFPLVFLGFMIPLPAIVVNAVAFPLQLFAAKVASASLFLLGLPVLREGNLIVLPGTTLEVAEACSGLRSLVSLLALGTVYGYFSQRALWKRWMLVILSIPIAIVANAFRVSGTGILAHFGGAEAAQGFYHTFEGWVVFVVAFLLLGVCGLILSHIGKQQAGHMVASTHGGCP